MKAVGENKRCSKCCEWKHVSEFYENKRRPDGRIARCKSCTREDTRATYYANRESLIERYRQNADIREKSLERCRQYQKDNRDKVRHQKRKYRAENIEKIRAKQRERYKKDRDKILKKLREAKCADRERRNEVARRNYAKNRERILAAHNAKRLQQSVEYQWMKEKLLELGVQV